MERAIKFKYDEHVSNLLKLPELYLGQILPNKRLPLGRILKDLNSDTSRELSRYGDALHAEIFRVLEQANLALNDHDRETILSMLTPYLDANLYERRFEIFLDSVERRLASYGLILDKGKHRIDIPQSLNEVGAENQTKRIAARISNDLDLLLERRKSSEFVFTDQQDNATRYSRIGKLYRDHQFLFWLIGVLVGVIGSAVIGIVMAL